MIARCWGREREKRSAVTPPPSDGECEGSRCMRAFYIMRSSRKKPRRAARLSRCSAHHYSSRPPPPRVHISSISLARRRCCSFYFIFLFCFDYPVRTTCPETRKRCSEKEKQDCRRRKEVLARHLILISDSGHSCFRFFLNSFCHLFIFFLSPLFFVPCREK